MKRLFFAFLIAAAALMVSCNNGQDPEPNPNPDTEEPYYGFNFERFSITNLGDMSGNGKTQFVVQMSTIDEFNTITRMMSAYIESDKVAPNGAMPEGTYDLLEGEYDENVTGSQYIYLDGNKIVYGVISEGTLEVKRTEYGYRFTVTASGYNGVDGEIIHEVQCRYEGLIGEVGTNRYRVTDVSAAYMGVTDGVPYWNVQMATTDNRIILLYVNTFEDNFEAGIPTYNYNIQSPYPSPEPGSVDCTYESYNGYSGSIVYVENADGTYAPEKMVVYGNVEITNNGNNNYDFKVVFYDNTFIPRVATYSGEIECVNYNVSEELETFSYLTYYGGNKWVVMLGNSITDLAPVLYCYGPEGLSFEDGLASGTYNVAENYTDFYKVASGTPFTIVPGLSEGTKYKGGSIFYTYDWTQVWDVVGYGSMDVVNHGDGTYDIQLALGGAFGNVYAEMDHSGAIDEIDDQSPKSVAPAKAAAKPATFKANFDRKTIHQFDTPALPLR